MTAAVALFNGIVWFGLLSLMFTMNWWTFGGGFVSFIVTLVYLKFLQRKARI